MKSGRQTLTRAVVALVVVGAVAGLAYVAWDHSPLHTFRISGTVTRDGKPPKWQGEPNLLLVLFAPVEEDKKDVYRAESDPITGTYVVPALPRGRYIVAIQQFEQEPYRDAFGGTYDLASTTFSHEVTGDADGVNFDIPLVIPPRKSRYTAPPPGGR
jgi:hypothetical protein